MPEGITFFDALEVQAARCGIHPRELYTYTFPELYNVFQAHILNTREKWELARFANPSAADVKFPWEKNRSLFTAAERKRLDEYIEKQKALGF